MAFTIQFAPPARLHLKALRKRDQQILLDAIGTRLTDRPEQPPRNQKKLQENQLAPWELRIGPFRVFYDVHGPEGIVVILAIGRKAHNVLRIGNEEVEL
jgi:mRNA interferase RelE/StbE